MNSDLVQAIDLIEINDDDSCSIVIDLENSEKTPEEVIFEWDAEIRQKFSLFSVADNENILDDLMKDYLKSLKEMLKFLEDNYIDNKDNEVLRIKVLCHIKFLYFYHLELQCCTSDCYLQNMEEILTVYCSIELEVIHSLKKNDKKSKGIKKRCIAARKRIIHVLTIFLLNKEEPMLHVLIKMTANTTSHSCKEILDVIYNNFLIIKAAGRISPSSDETFCRSYILFQKWKQIRKEECWKDMDSIMFSTNKRDASCLKTSRVLKEILTPMYNSIMDVICNIFVPLDDIIQKYFEYIKSKKNIQIDQPDDLNLDSLDEVFPVLSVENGEDNEISDTYEELENAMNSLTNETATRPEPVVQCKEEHSEDEIEIVDIVMPETLLKNQKNRRNTSPCSFLDSIKIKPQTNFNGLTKSSRELVKSEMLVEPNPSPVCSAPVADSPNILIEDEDPLADFNKFITQNNDSLDGRSTVDIVSNKDITSNRPEKLCENVEAQVDHSLVLVNVESESDNVKNDNNVKTSATTDGKDVRDNCKKCLYEYGLITPPSDVPADENHVKSLEMRVYTDIGRTHNGDSVRKSVDYCTQEQTDKTTMAEGNQHVVVETNCEAEFLNSDECDINCELEIIPNCENFNDSQILIAQETNERGNVSIENENDDENLNAAMDLFLKDVDQTRKAREQKNGENCQDSLEHLAINAEYFEDVVDTFHSTDNDVVGKDDGCGDFQSNDNIDTGQEVILNDAPNIEIPPTPQIEKYNNNLDSCIVTNSSSKIIDGFNDTTVLKPLFSPNENTTKDVNVIHLNKHNQPSDDVNTCSNKAILATKVTTKPEKIQWSSMKENNVNDVQYPKIQSNNLAHSSSNSPTEFTSPAYEAMGDFSNYYKDISQDVITTTTIRSNHDPPGILKKPHHPKRKNNQKVMFNSKTKVVRVEYSRQDNGGIERVTFTPQWMKLMRRDRKLRMLPVVVLNRSKELEDAVKPMRQNCKEMDAALSSGGTIRVDYDKSTKCINENDMVRRPLPIKMDNTGSLGIQNMQYVGIKSMKRKYEPKIAHVSADSTVVKPKRVFRTSKKTIVENAKQPTRTMQQRSTKSVTNSTKLDITTLVNGGAYYDKPFRMNTDS